MLILGDAAVDRKRLAGADPPHFSFFPTPVVKVGLGSGVNLRLALKDEFGAIFTGGETTLDLGPNEQVSRPLEELFPEAETQELRGMLTVTAEGGKVVAVALQVRSRPGRVVALPVKELR